MRKECFYMENKSRIIFKIIIIVLIVCVIVTIGFFALNHNIRSKNIDDIQELKEFDLTVI